MIASWIGNISLQVVTNYSGIIHSTLYNDEPLSARMLAFFIQQLVILPNLELNWIEFAYAKC
jgi:hypothetical protein